MTRKDPDALHYPQYGRPRAAGPKVHVVNVRLTPEIKRALDTVAESMTLSSAAAHRVLLVEALRARGALRKEPAGAA